MPPLKGALLDREFVPTAAEEQRVFDRLLSKDKPQDDVNGTEAAGTQADENSQAAQQLSDVNRRSGTSDILGRAATERVELANRVAGGKKPEDVTAVDVLRGITLDDFKNAYKMPCFTTSFVQGMTAGFLVAGGAWIVGRRVGQVANVAVYTTLGASSLSFVYCNYQRQREKKTVRIIKEAWEVKQEEKKVEWEQLKAKKFLEAQSKRSQASSWWRFWEGREVRPRGREG
jgi:cytochrome c oxidase assembly protein subunit 20